MATTTYKVKWGDTLTSIAKTYNTTVNELVRINKIKDPNYIVVGQILKIDGEPDNTPEYTPKTPIINVFGLQTGTTRTVYAAWKWSGEHTKEYSVRWKYFTGPGDPWIIGEESTVTAKQSVYTAPNNATMVEFTVRPKAKTHKVNGKDVVYWTASEAMSRWDFEDNPPGVPPAPTVKMNGVQLTAEVNNLGDLNASIIQFQVAQDSVTEFYLGANSGKVDIKTDSASVTSTMVAGSKYKVRCRAIRNDVASAWSSYSSEVDTAPSTPTISKCEARSETSVYVEWSDVSNATSYDIEHTTDKSYFDGSNNTTTINDLTTTHYELTGLSSGDEYFFRVRASNSVGKSGWSEISSSVIGTGPAAPTTWSSTTTVVTGEELILYWVHNSEDGSSQTYADLELDVDGTKTMHRINNDRPEADKDKTSSYVIDTTSYTEGVKIKWRVRTAGVTNSPGEWSILRTVDVYAKPTLILTVTDRNQNQIDTLSEFPFKVSALAGPTTQRPIGYHLMVKSNETYETIDDIGNPKIVSAGSEVYSRHFDIDQNLAVYISASDIDLENGKSYTISCIVSMNSGLTAESSITDFKVRWYDEVYTVNAQVGVDTNIYATYIQPYCKDKNNNLVSGITLSVYRREFDGSFTEIAKGLANTGNTYVTDPHPALDYARYRIVAISNATGSVSYNDIPGYPVGGNAVIIQWADTWSNFDVTSGNPLAQPPWSGSLLKLPYNIDISDSSRMDVALIEYIGRKHPVSYYGTQLGTTSTWNMSIPKHDKETLYTLRRLAVWTGDVYVREPSGSGYWASISVSFSQKHCEVTIPVTIEVTRVEGGM